MSKRTVIFIGGAPLSGKSTLAVQLSRTLSVPWVSTDDIRKWMQALVRKEDYPNLFDGHGLAVEAFYKKFRTAKEVLEQELRQSLDVQKGITAMADNFWWWDMSIIEGIAVTPFYVKQFQESHLNFEVKTIFLIDNDTESIRERLYKRGLWGDAKTYPDHIKPTEFEWILLFNQYYIHEARTHDFDLHDITELGSLKKQMAESKK